MQPPKFPYQKSKLHAGITPTGVLLIYLKKYRVQMGIIFLSVLIGEVLLTSVSYVIKTIVDTIYQIQNGQSSIQSLYFLAGTVSIMGLLSNFSYRLSGFTARSFFPYVRRDVRVDFFTYLHAHAHRYFSNHFGGALTNKINTVGRACSDILETMSWDIFPSIINISLSLVFLFLASPTTGFITLGISIFYWTVFYPFLKKARTLFTITSNARSISTGKVADVITNIWNLQSHARGRYEEDYLVNVFEDEANKNLTSWGYMERIRLWQGVVMAFFIAAIGIMAIWLWSIKQISIGSIVLVFIVSPGILQSVRSLAQRMLDFNEKKSDIQDAITTIIVPYEIEPQEYNEQEPSITDGSIELQNMTFAYDERGNVFENLSLTIPHGQKVGFVGVSGSGKTTLVLLLQRFYEITSGKIIIGGHDISTISQDTLRRAIAVVPQDPVLFHRSLFENIAYGSPNASHEEVIEASRLAHADEFIATTPEGYEAKVGERGVKLSGGQRQRVAIARAILKASPILLLDEATSALDSESEELIQAALKKVMEGKTVIAIAHRLSTLKNMDRIIVLSKGKIIEDGSHEELLKKSGTYAYLYKKQVQGFMTEE